MVQVFVRALVAAGITACIVAAAAAGFLSVIPPAEPQSPQPATTAEPPDTGPPPLIAVFNRSQLE